MFNRGKKDRITYGIIGLGRFGFALARELADAGADILVMDRDEEKIREMRDYTDNAYVVRNLDRKTLGETGVQNCDVAVVCIGEDLATSILTVLNLVSLGVGKVIAKAKSAQHGEILEKLGAEVVYPERDMAVRLAHRMETAKMLDFVQLSERVNISKLEIPEELVGKTVRGANLRGRFGVNIIAIEHGREVMESIDPDYVFGHDDILFVCGGRENLGRLLERARG